MLWAVHISDGILMAPWLLGGFALAAGLALFGAWRIRDEEIPQVALLAAAFFVVSLIHARVGPTTVHLFFNGLLGVMLGRRVCLAVPVGLFLQAALFGHGGFSTLGINSCVMVLPGLLAWGLFCLLQRVPWAHQPWWAALLGIAIGFNTVFVTALLNALVLLWGGQEDWHALVLVVFVAHLPIAVVEGVVLGFVVGFLVRVKPQMIGWPGMENAECVAESLP